MAMDRVDPLLVTITKVLVELETVEAIKLMMLMMIRKAKVRKSRLEVSRLTSAQPKTAVELV